MTKFKSCAAGLIALAAMIGSATVQADPITWFSEDPTSVKAALAAEGVSQYGTWSVGSGSLSESLYVGSGEQDGKVCVDTDGENRLAYTPKVQLTGNTATITLENICFTAPVEVDDSQLEGVQAAVAIVDDPDSGALAFMVADNGQWAKAEDNDVPTAADTYTISCDFNYDKGKVTYHLPFGGEYEADIPEALWGTKVSVTEFEGTCSFESLSGELKVAYLAWQEGVTGFTYKYNGATETKSGLEGTGSETIALVDGVTALEVTDITYAPGKMGEPEAVFELESGETYTLEVADIAATVKIGDVETPYASIEEAVGAINDAGEIDSAELVLAADVTETISIENNEIGELVVDLAGKNITVESGYGIYSASALKVINSEDVLGLVEACEGADGAVAADNDLTIENGKFIGGVTSDVTVFVNGGFFNPEPIEDATIPENYQWTAEPDEDGFYTIEEILSEQATVIFVVNKGTPQTAKFDVGSTINLNEEAAKLVTMASWQGFAGDWVAEDGTEYTEFTIEAEGTYMFENTLDIKLEKDGDDVYQITSEDDLETLAAAVADSYDTSDKTFKQTSDITMTNAWPGIGTYQSTTKCFAGTYDGNGKAIKEVVMADNGTEANTYRGFFNQIDGGTVKNLTVETFGFGENSPAGEYGCAAIAGAAYNATIENCTAQGAISSATHNAGGIVIRIKDTTVRNCTNAADIIGNYTKVAGIVVLNQNSTSACLIEGCVNKGTITADGNTEKAGKDGIAGIIAYVGDDKLTIKDCSNEGALIEGENANAAAKIGQIVAYTYKGAQFDGDITGRADTLMFGDTTNDTGLNFATVDGNVATLVADTAVATGNTYKVVSPLKTFAYQFTAETAEISFLTNLNTAIAFTITDKDGKAVEPTAIDGGVKYAVSAPTPALPSYIPDGAPEVVITRYGEWAAKYGADAGSANEAAYLLDCDPKDVETKKAEFKVESIEFKDGKWVVTVAGQKLEGDTYGNGYVKIISVKDKFQGAGEGSDFFQAVLKVVPVK